MNIYERIKGLKGKGCSPEMEPAKLNHKYKGPKKPGYDETIKKQKGLDFEELPESKMNIYERMKLMVESSASKHYSKLKKHSSVKTSKTTGSDPADHDNKTNLPKLGGKGQQSTNYGSAKDKDGMPNLPSNAKVNAKGRKLGDTQNNDGIPNATQQKKGKYKKVVENSVYTQLRNLLTK